MLPTLIEFFDVGFLRLLWALFVEYLVATGFLNADQHDQWINGVGHIISVAGTVVFLAIWQWHSHKKSVTKVVETVEVTPVVKDNFFKSFLKRYLIQTTKETPVE